MTQIKVKIYEEYLRYSRFQEKEVVQQKKRSIGEHHEPLGDSDYDNHPDYSDDHS